MKDPDQSEKFLLLAATEEMRDGDEYYGAQRRCGQGVEEAAAKDSKFDEDPAPKVRANQSQNDVGEATEAAAARDFASDR